MPTRAHLSQLPDDLVAGILARLPLRQVARARLVCRRWHALTTDHHFVRTSFSRPHVDYSAAGFFFNDRFAPTSRYFPVDDEADRLSPDVFVIPSTRSANPGRRSMRIHGSCSGLLLLTFWPSHCQEIHCVWNPLTKKLIPIGVPKGVSSCLTLAFDPSKSRHYKIVALGDMHSIHVYSSETRSWRMAIHSDHSAGLFQGLCPTRGIFWNGSVVWIVARSLVRFIVEGEHVTKMSMPPKRKDWICAYIGESAGHLQMIGYTKKEKLTACFDILEMQENQSEWSVLHRIDLSQVKVMYPDIERPTWDTQNHQQKIIDYLALSPIYVIRGTGKTGQHGVLIFSIPGKIMSYTMEDQQISIVQEIRTRWTKMLASPFEHFWYNFYAYNSSLFAL